jgi:hypothetical protein
MTSYMSSISKWFKAGYEGRHLELVLLEIAKLKPKAISSYLAEELGVNVAEFDNAEYAIEVPFQGQRSQRRADMAVWREGQADPFVLIEIKYFDKPLVETENHAEQFADYRHWKGRVRGRHVLVLSRELYQARGIEVRRWDHLARALREPAKRSDLIAMLVDYLEEEGIVMQNVDGATLERYFVRLVCHDRNVGRAAGNLDGPIEFAKVLKNLQMMSGTFTPKFKRAWGEAGEQIDGLAVRSRVASIDFQVRNKVRAVKDASRYRDNDGELPQDMKDGGYIDVFATHSLGHGEDRLRIQYGIIFTVPSSAKPLLFVNAYGKQVDTVENITAIGPTLVTDKAEQMSERVEGYLRDSMCVVIGQLLHNHKALNDKQIHALRLLKKSLPATQIVDAEDITM